MNTIISDEEWEHSCREGHKVTNSPTWREFEWKVKMRFFRTPLVASKFRDTLDQCWRGCGWVGGHTHMFWDCPKLSGYWHNIQNEIKKCLKIEVPLEPSYFLIGILPENLENSSQISLLRILLLVAKKMITISWLKPQPPTVTQWRDKGCLLNGKHNSKVTTIDRQVHDEMVTYYFFSFSLRCSQSSFISMIFFCSLNLSIC